MVALNISLEPEFVITAQLGLLLQREKELGLSEEQQVKVREVRKKGRNNLHARNCRKRKADKTTELQVIEPIDLSGARRGKGGHL